MLFCYLYTKLNKWKALKCLWQTADEVLNFIPSPQLADLVSLWNDGHCTHTFFFSLLFKEYRPLDCWVICSVFCLLCLPLSDWVHDVEAAETPAEGHFGWWLWRRWTKTFSWAFGLISRSFQIWMMRHCICEWIEELLPRTTVTWISAMFSLLFCWHYFKQN